MRLPTRPPEGGHHRLHTLVSETSWAMAIPLPARAVYPIEIRVRRAPSGGAGTDRRPIAGRGGRLDRLWLGGFGCGRSHRCGRLRRRALGLGPRGLRTSGLGDGVHEGDVRFAAGTPSTGCASRKSATDRPVSA